MSLSGEYQDSGEQERHGPLMSRLISWSAGNPASVLLETSDPEQIAAELAAAGCRFERREVRSRLLAEAEQAQVLAAHQDVVDAEVTARGFVTVDVAGISPESPGREPPR
jgi:1,2-dihydroxy-3-keto-5-methylthiopentene dioxygenase